MNVAVWNPKTREGVATWTGEPLPRRGDRVYLGDKVYGVESVVHLPPRVRGNERTVPSAVVLVRLVSTSVEELEAIEYAQQLSGAKS